MEQLLGVESISKVLKLTAVMKKLRTPSEPYLIEM